MASSSSLMPAPNYKYDVFPSFHGSDVRKTFLSHIRKQFKSNGITMFDDEGIKRSSEIAPSLIKVIRESRNSIVVFSKNYASSRWCLDELVEILECRKARGQNVIPIYYGVDSSEVRKQTGEFGKAFNETCASKTEEERQKWINALEQVTNINDGYISLNWKHEADMIAEITNDVLNKLNRTRPRDLDDTVTLPLLVEMAGISRPSGIDPSDVRRRTGGNIVGEDISSHDVFCSFHGPDVGKTLLSHVRKQFKSNGITMFDDQGIERSEENAPSLIKAIRESKISIVILSKQYASSSWYLDELVEILECRKGMGQIVMTIFYGVDPSDVRKQSGEFGDAFHETCTTKTEEEKQKWRKALNEVSNIDGEDSLYWVSEADMIEKIAKDVLHELNATQSIDSDDSETKPLLGSDNDGIEMGEISGHSGIDPSDVRTGNLGVLLDEICSSTTEEDFLSCSSEVEEMRVVDIPPPDDNENQPASQKQRASRTKVKIEWSLLIIFFILEIPSCVLDQISSTDRP